jgi:rubrerythrin
MEEKTLKGTQTEKNLLKAFAGESQAKNRYTYFAKKAKSEGFEQIAAIFLETAIQEEQHAKMFFRFLEGGMVEITASYPAGVIGTTAQNLHDAAEGEHEEYTLLYPQFAEIAKQEGFPKIAAKFKVIAQAEAQHENRYRKLLENLVNDRVFIRETPVKWMCRKCGYVYEGTKALANCPACDHPQAYFELLQENY